MALGALSCQPLPPSPDYLPLILFYFSLYANFRVRIELSVLEALCDASLLRPGQVSCRHVHLVRVSLTNCVMSKVSSARKDGSFVHPMTSMDDEIGWPIRYDPSE